MVALQNTCKYPADTLRPLKYPPHRDQALTVVRLVVVERAEVPARAALLRHHVPAHHRLEVARVVPARGIAATTPRGSASTVDALADRPIASGQDTEARIR